MPRTAEDISTLLAAHGQQLFALLVRLTLRYDVAEDLLQELFCKLAASPGFQRADNALAYAHRAATNLALDWRRAKKNQIASSNQYEAIQGTNHSPLADLIRREQLDQVLNSVAALPSPAREIIVLRHLEHESYETIAARLGKTKHQVRALSFKAIKKLRTSLEKPKTTKTQEIRVAKIPNLEGSQPLAGG